MVSFGSSPQPPAGSWTKTWQKHQPKRFSKTLKSTNSTACSRTTEEVDFKPTERRLHSLSKFYISPVLSGLGSYSTPSKQWLDVSSSSWTFSSNQRTGFWWKKKVCFQISTSRFLHDWVSDRIEMADYQCFFDKSQWPYTVGFELSNAHARAIVKWYNWDFTPYSLQKKGPFFICKSLKMRTSDPTTLGAKEKPYQTYALHTPFSPVTIPQSFLVGTSSQCHSRSRRVPRVLEQPKSAVRKSSSWPCGLRMANSNSSLLGWPLI